MIRTAVAFGVPLNGPTPVALRRILLRRVRSVLVGALLGWIAGGAIASEPSMPLPLRQPALITPKALGAAMLTVVRAGARLVAAGERGTVLWSDDQGKTWQQAEVPVQATLTALRFVDDRTGWAVGHMGVVLRSDDGGQTWVKQLDGVQAARLVLAEAQSSGDEAAVARAQHLGLIRKLC